MTQSTNESRSTTTGSAMSEGVYLDEHFEACKPEYESMLRSIGLELGWHVLDAGKNSFACSISTKVGSISQLPYEDNTFDAVWCANITQYLSDEDLKITLDEFQRVLKPNGLLALKDVLMPCMQVQPLDPLLLARFYQSEVNANTAHMIQALRNTSLTIWVRHAGYTNISARTTMTERMQPLRDVERSFFGSLIGFLASAAVTEKRVSKSDLEIWETLADVKSPEHILFHPDFYYREGHIVVTANKKDVL